MGLQVGRARAAPTSPWRVPAGAERPPPTVTFSFSSRRAGALRDLLLPGALQPRCSVCLRAPSAVPWTEPRGEGTGTEGDDAQSLAGDRHETEPAQRARELRAAWERFLGGDRAGHGARADRGLLAALPRPPASTLPVPARRRSVADDDEAAARWEVHPLVSSAPLIRECLAGIADDAAHLMVISDADGTLLWLEGAPSVRLAAANSMNFVDRRAVERGRRGHERDRHRARRRPRRAGVRRRALQRGRPEWTCAAAPVHDPETGRGARDRRPHLAA